MRFWDLIYIIYRSIKWNDNRRQQLHSKANFFNITSSLPIKITKDPNISHATSSSEIIQYLSHISIFIQTIDGAVIISHFEAII